MKNGLATAAFIAFAVVVAPQTALCESNPPLPKPDDLRSIDGIIAALYDVVSGPAGEQIDWDRMRSLFIPEGHIIGDPLGGTSPVVWPIDKYVETFDPLLTNAGFWEKEVARRTEEFRGIAHVFSTYEGRREEHSDLPIVSGVNSIQLMHDGKRWWIVSILFQGATPEHALPAKHTAKVE